MELAASYLQSIETLRAVRSVSSGDLALPQGAVVVSLYDGLIVTSSWDSSRPINHELPRTAAEAVLAARAEVGRAISQASVAGADEKRLLASILPGTFQEDRGETNPDNVHKQQTVGRIRVSAHKGDIRADFTRYYDPRVEGSRDDAVSHLAKVVDFLGKE